jgi:hypothetical protein
MIQRKVLSIAGLSFLCSYLVAMEPSPQATSLADSLTGSQIGTPGAIPGHEDSPLLWSTLKHLRQNRTIRSLETPVVIDDNATALITNGGALIHAIRQNQHIDAINMDAEQPEYIQEFSGSQQNYLSEILSVAWYLYSEAINKDQAFVDGSFIILDKDYKLYNFLMYYARKVNPALTGTTADPLAHSSNNPFAYSRASSHWTTTQNAWRPYGIDMRFAQDQASLPILPAGKSHLLFAIVAAEPTPRLFIKFEDIGIYGGQTILGALGNGGELFGHAWNYLKSRIPKQEKNIAQWIYDPLFRPIFGSDEGPEARREHTSVDFTRHCYEILSSPTVSAKVCSEYYRELEKHGVSKLGELVENKPGDWTDAIHKAFTQYYHELCGRLDYPKIRKGCEVILGPDELFSSLYFHCLAQNNTEKAKQAGMLYEILKRHRSIAEQLNHITKTLELKRETITQAEIAATQDRGERLIQAQERLQQKAEEVFALVNQAH